MKQRSRQTNCSSPSSRKMLLLETLLLVSQMSAGFAFEPTPISIIPSRPRIDRQIVIAPPRALSAHRKLINTHNDVNSCLLKHSHISSSTSSTSLFLFGKFGKDNGDKVTDDDQNVEEATPADDANANIRSFLKVALPSFLAGGIATLGFLFLPLLADYHDAFNGGSINNNFQSSEGMSKVAAENKNVNNVNQPVILFETILNDLNDAYVDKVDVQKLFETGVKAMTASLDPYTEFESRLEARELEESVTGKYGGVGLVIRGGTNLKLLSEEEDVSSEEKPIVGGSSKEEMIESPSTSDKPLSISSPPVAVRQNDGGRVNKLEKKATDKDEDVDLDEIERKRARKKSMEDGIRVVSAFEGYAYDAGMRVGDKLLAIDDFDIKPTTAVDEVRNHLRGEPGTPVSIMFLRDGVNEPQTITIERSVVHIPDVKYFGFIGDPSDGIGYIDLSGFANDAGREVRYAIRALQHGSSQLAASDSDVRDDAGLVAMDPTKLKGLVLDLRSNPGGLLTSAVDVATLFVPHGSDIVSAKGRGFPETLYKSVTEPILDPKTRLAVLVNEQTASAAEIVAGAIQDLDVGVIVGKGRTFGKGLVQNVQDLPYQTALKYTVAKYYTPSGRCIQSTVYEEGSSADAENGGAKYKSKKVADKDRNVFLTAHGRQVKDGGGVEVDYKIDPQKASPLEVILLNSGTYSDYAAEWSKSHLLTDKFKVDDSTYKDFQRFVEQRQKEGDIKLEVVYEAQLKELQRKLKASKFDSARRELDALRADIIKDIKKDFSVYKAEITEDLEQNILARYLPDSMLIERGLRSDVQVSETAKMLKDGREFDKLLARNNVPEKRYESTSAMKPAPDLLSRL